jgi:hypothetical protein
MKVFRFVGILVSGVVLAGMVAAQNVPKVSKASEAYRTYRGQNTYPKFHLEKIKKLIKTVKVPEGGRAVLSDAKFKALSLEEKFTYCLFHAEDETQNCDVMLPVVDEEKKIFAYFPGPFHDEYIWSPRQKNFFEANREQVIGLLSKNIRQMGRVGANFKGLIITMQLVQLIPDLVRVYKIDRKDHDILTLLMMLMAEAKYEPFLESASFKKLFSESAQYGNFLVANKENQDLIMSRAMALYKAAN